MALEYFITGHASSEDLPTVIESLCSKGDVAFSYVNSPIPGLSARVANKQVLLPRDSSLILKGPAIRPTPVVPIGEDCQALVEKMHGLGVTFRLAKVKAGENLSFNLPGIFKQDHLPRNVAGPLPPGICVFGTSYCSFTRRCISSLAAESIPFYYVDVTNDRKHYESQLGARLSAKYLFSDANESEGVHDTVPIVFLDGEIIGGSRELGLALASPKSRAVVNASVRSAESQVILFALPATPSEVMAAIYSGNPVVRVVPTVRLD